MNKKFKHIISLGSSCGVATMLEKNGMRNNAYPFDWIISAWDGVEQSIKCGFTDWFDIDLLYQSTDLAKAYKNRKYNLKFFHDFNEYDPLCKQIEKVKKKYQRRGDRFNKNIQEPCLFIRFILADESEREIEYLYSNYDSILAHLKSYNVSNEICFIILKKDFPDFMRSGNFGSRVFLLNDSDYEDCSKAVELNGNRSIVEYLKSLVDMGNYDSNILFANNKNKRKKSFINRVKNKITNLCRKKYKHHKQYNKDQYYE